MDYRELSPPAALAHMVKLGWELSIPPSAPAWVTHIAAPDGCMEIIRRMNGRSVWQAEQPECFVAGVITKSAELKFARGSRFIGLRLWPWAWNSLGGSTAGALLDRWADLADALPGYRMPADVESAFADLAVRLPSAQPFHEQILASRRVSDLRERSGRGDRWLQRWFAREISLPPRTYLRLLRFAETFEDLHQAEGTLARHAADHGFADQAHMAREFRSMAGAPATTSRRVAVGPFLRHTP